MKSRAFALAPVAFLIAVCATAHAEVDVADGAAEDYKSLRLPNNYLELPPGYAKPASAWKSSERAFYRQLLSSGAYDTLVVPFQTERGPLSRATRSLMTAQLVSALAGSGQLQVPDPYLVSRAFGDGERSVSVDDIYLIANALKVRRLVLVTVAWPGSVRFPPPADARMQITVQHQERDSKGTLDRFGAVAGKTFAARIIANDPFRTFSRRLADIAGFLGAKPASNTPAPAATAALVVPIEPQAMVSGNGSAAGDAYALQFLAALTPQDADRTRERFYEKSLLAAARLAPGSPDRRLLEARALSQLGYRQAARDALGTLNNDEARELAASLDGNLPDVLAAAAKITRPLPRAIAQLEANEIAMHYGLRHRNEAVELAKSLALPGKIWPFLAVRAASDDDSWAQFENLHMKVLLDQEFPIEGFTAKGIVGGAATLADGAKTATRIDLAVLQHVRKALQTRVNAGCCRSLQARPAVVDYLDLLEAIGTDNLVRGARFEAAIQGSPEHALEQLRRYESVYKEHPHFVLVRAQAELKLAQRSDAASKEGYLRAAYEDAYNVLYWEQDQTPTAATAARFFWGPEGLRYLQFHNPYLDDTPYRSYYACWTGDNGVDRWLPYMTKALENSTSDYSPAGELFYMAEMLPGSVDVASVMRSLQGRFAGHPKRSMAAARQAAHSGDTASAEKNYRQVLAADPNNWDARKELATSLFQRGRVDEASDVFAADPGFKPDSRDNPVGRANAAGEAGDLFFWSGYFPQSRRFYKIASDLKTGAESSLIGEARLHLMDGDLQPMLEGSLARAQRYESPSAFSDYLSLLHAMGHSPEAWQGFDALASQVQEPQIWESALVGHRLAGLDEAALEKWAVREPFRNMGDRTNTSAVYLLRGALTDRMPTDQLPSRIEALERPAWKTGEFGTLRASGDGQSAYVLGPRMPGMERSYPVEVDSLPDKTRVPSDLAVFAKAYRDIRAGRFAKAVDTFTAADAALDFSVVSLRYAVPYLAYAAARAGRPRAAEDVLARFDPEERRFDYLLSKGVLAALNGKSAEALPLLQNAILGHPYNENRPVLVAYEYAELCEWLFEATQDARYRDIALSWAQKNQVLEPWLAWPYAMEAKLSRDAKTRGRAIAMVNYLDRKSERLATVPRKEIDAAVREYAGRLPFPAPDGFAKKRSM